MKYASAVIAVAHSAWSYMLFALDVMSGAGTLMNIFIHTLHLCFTLFFRSVPSIYNTHICINPHTHINTHSLWNVSNVNFPISLTLKKLRICRSNKHVNEPSVERSRFEMHTSSKTYKNLLALFLLFIFLSFVRTRFHILASSSSSPFCHLCTHLQIFSHMHNFVLQKKNVCVWACEYAAFKYIFVFVFSILFFYIFNNTIYYSMDFVWFRSALQTLTFNEEPWQTNWERLTKVWSQTHIICALATCAYQFLFLIGNEWNSRRQRKMHE